MSNEDVVDPAAEAISQNLGDMQTGDRKIIGVEEFRNLLHAIHTSFNLAEDNSGVIEDKARKFEYSRTGDESDVLVKRVV